LPPKATKGGTPKKFCASCFDNRRRERQRVKAPAELSEATKMAVGEGPQSTGTITSQARPDGARLISLSDTQYPFADEPLVEAVERFMRDWQPDDVLYNGDIQDMYEISDFDKDPKRQFNLTAELDMGRAMLDRHAAIVPKAKKKFIFGNHEDRLRRFIWRHAGAIADLVKPLEEALELGERGIEFVTYGKHVDYLSFVFTHGNFVSSGSGMTARRHLASYGSSGAHGHTHRLGSISKTDMNGRTHTFYEQGCLCRVDLEYNRGVADWQQGFLIGEVQGGALHPQLIHVIDSRGQKGFVAAGNYYRIGRA
jgi:hypothetical protein